MNNLEIVEFKGGLTCYAINIPKLPRNTALLALVSKAGTVSEYGEKEAGYAHLLQHLLPRAAAEQEGSGLVPKHREADYDHSIISYDVKDHSYMLDEVMKLFRLISSQRVSLNSEMMEEEEDILNLEYQGSQIAMESRRKEILHSFLVEGAFSSKKALKNLERINYNKLSQFYNKWYIPNEMAVLIIGNIFTVDVLAGTKVKNRLSKPVNTIPSYEKIWCPGVVTREYLLTDKQMPNALVFKLKRPSTLLDKWAMEMMVNAVDKRLEQSIGGFAYSEDKGLNTYIVLATFTDVKKLVHEFFRLMKHAFTKEEMAQSFTNIHVKLQQADHFFHHDNHLLIEVLQKKFIKHFLYGDVITSPGSELKQFEDTENALYTLQIGARVCLFELEIGNARIYLREPCKSWDGLIEEAQKEQLIQWGARNLNFNEHWKCENLIPPTTKNLKELQMQEICLANGMTILFCESDVPYSCSLKGFAYGGMSHSNTTCYPSTYFAMSVATRLPPFGHNRPIVGSDNIKLVLDIQDYLRSFEAHFDTSKLAVAFQLIFLLFCDKPTSTKDELVKVRELICTDWNPASNLFKAYEYSSGVAAFFHKVLKRSDAECMDPVMALDFFNKWFLDPSQFTVVIAGDFDFEEALELANKYLGSIPRESCPIFPSRRADLKSYYISFSPEIVKRDIRCRQSFTEVFITVPVTMGYGDIAKQDEHEALLDCLRKIVEHRLTELLCHVQKEVYTVDGVVLFDGKKYSSPESQEAVLFVRLSYKRVKKEIDWKLAETALSEIQRIVSAPTNEDIRSLWSYPKKTLVRSSDVMEEAVEAYQSKLYQGDLQRTILERREMFKNIDTRSVEQWKEIFESLVPFGCKEKYVFIAFHSRGRNTVEVLPEMESDMETDM